MQKIPSSQLALQFGGSSSVGVGVLSVSRAVADAVAHVAANARTRGVTPLGATPAPSPSPLPCANGVEITPFNIASNSLEIKLFYDMSCTMLHKDFKLSLNANAGGSTVTITGSETTYAMDGVTVVDSSNLNLTVNMTNGTESSFELQAMRSTTTSQPSSTLGLSCTIGSTVTCADGAVVHSPPINADQGLTDMATLTFTAGSGVTLSGNGTVYAGPLNALVLAPMSGTGPVPSAWTITGATQSTPFTITASVLFSPNGLLNPGTQLSFVTQAANGSASDTVTITVSQSGQIMGTITDTTSGAQVATFTVDQSGNGTITFANGTTETITDWTIAS